MTDKQTPKIRSDQHIQNSNFRFKSRENAHEVVCGAKKIAPRPCDMSAILELCSQEILYLRVRQRVTTRDSLHCTKLRPERTNVVGILYLLAKRQRCRPLEVAVWTLLLLHCHVNQVVGT
jgi:hypothetical protein